MVSRTLFLFHLSLLFINVCARFALMAFTQQTTTAADEIMLIVPSANSPQRADLSIVQGQESLTKPEKAQEEGTLSRTRRRARVVISAKQ